MSAIKRQYYRELDKDPYYQYECNQRDITWWNEVNNEHNRNTEQDTDGIKSP